MIASATEPSVSASNAEGERVCQGVVCGAWALAFEFGWARAIVEDFDLVAVPRAPEWLVGAASIDGELVPVVELARYIQPGQAPLDLESGHRLLIGGVGAATVGILFSQRPNMIRFVPEPVQHVKYLPAPLREMARAQATTPGGGLFIDVDPKKLMAQLDARLSQ